MTTKQNDAAVLTNERLDEMVRGYLDFMVGVCEQQESEAVPMTNGSNFEHPPLRGHK